MSCLFHSIGACLGFTQEAVRHDILEYMVDNADKKHDDVKLKDWIESAEDVSFEAYLADMRKEDTWGGAVELDIACLLYNANVIVHFNKKRIVIGTPRSKELHIKYTGNHFEPLGMRLTPRTSAT
jgi:hypothetical protein